MSERSEENAEKLIRMLEDVDVQNRTKAVLEIYRTCEVGDKHFVKPLIKRLLEDTDGFVRSISAHALGKIKDRHAIRPLIGKLKDLEVRVRGAVALALGEIGDRRAVVPLIEALKDEHEFVRWGAAIALGRIGDKRAIKPLAEAAKSEWDSETLRRMRRAIAKINEEAGE